VPQKRCLKQAHKLTEEVITFINETRKKEPSIRLADLVTLIEERFGTKVHPRSIERSLLRHQKKTPLSAHAYVSAVKITGCYQGRIQSNIDRMHPFGVRPEPTATFPNLRPTMISVAQ
jgi:hypothetical protein